MPETLGYQGPLCFGAQMTQCKASLGRYCYGTKCPLDAQLSQTLNTRICSGQIKAVYWQGTKLGEQQATIQNLNSLMVFKSEF